MLRINFLQLAMYQYAVNFILVDDHAFGLEEVHSNDQRKPTEL